MPAQSPAPDDDALWVLSGRLVHTIYSPKGDLEGLLLDVDGIAVQFVVPHGAGESLAALRAGQALVLEGSVADASDKGPADHEVYHLHRLVSVDGADLAERDGGDSAARGTVVRLNYARHGAPNGVVLDSGDFVHTRPDGFASLGLEIGMRVAAEGDVRPLCDGSGRVVEARVVNGRALAPKKPRPHEHAR